MNIKVLKKDEIFPITKYNFSNFNEKKSVSFTGSIINHPYDKEKFILISDPLSDHTQFIEFTKSDVVYIEDLSSITSKNGESIHLIKLWIKQGVVALRYEPFIVGKTINIVEKFNNC